MGKLSKRMRSIKDQVDSSKRYAPQEAMTLLQSVAPVKFVESVDAAIVLKIDPRKSEQNVRGASLLPNGIGRLVRVAVFAAGADADAATAAGAECVGLEALADEVKKGFCDFDVVIATPEAMPIVGQLGAILGPKGLMPNPKVGTVTQDVTSAVINAKRGQVRYRNDKGGVIHTTIGRVNFTPEQLVENLNTLLLDLRRLKPATSKGHFFQQVTLSTTMGPGVALDPNYLR